MNERQRERVGLNEALFREVNEQIEGLNARFGSDNEAMTIVCECADGGCTDQFDVTIAAYERVRADPRLFLIVPGHDVPDIEDVVDASGAYEVVRKRDPRAREVAEDTDPRS